MERSILELSELTVLANEADIQIYEARIPFEKIYKEGILLYSIDDFIALTKTFEVKAIFHLDIFTDKEDYLLPVAENYSSFDITQQLIEEAIIEYNQTLSEKDFTRAMYQYLFFTAEGQIYFIYFENTNLSELTEVEEKLEEIKRGILSRFSKEELEQIRLERRRIISEKIECIRNKVIGDEQFHTATNSALRLKYGRDFFEIHPEYRQTLKEAGYLKVSTFLDEAWKMYKSNKK